MKFRILIASFLLMLSAFSSSFAQDKQLAKEIDNLLRRDSINELIILELKKQLSQPADTSGGKIVNTEPKINPGISNPSRLRASK